MVSSLLSLFMSLSSLIKQYNINKKVQKGKIRRRDEYARSLSVAGGGGWKLEEAED